MSRAQRGTGDRRKYMFIRISGREERPPRQRRAAFTMPRPPEERDLCRSSGIAGVVRAPWRQQPALTSLLLGESGGVEARSTRPGALSEVRQKGLRGERFFCGRTAQPGLIGKG